MIQTSFASEFRRKYSENDLVIQFVRERRPGDENYTPMLAFAKTAWLQLIVAVLLGLFAAGKVSAADCDLWNRGFYFQSEDLTPVTITLRSPAPSQASLKLVVPRAYIVLAGGYKPQSPLPSEITTELLQLRLIFPGGNPTTIEVLNLIKSNPSLSCKRALDQFRDKEFSVEVRLSSLADTFEKMRQAKMFEEYVSEQDGLLRYKRGGWEVFVPTDQKRRVARITCTKSNPALWCRHAVFAGSNLVLIASFADFRSRGGSSFIFERTRMLQEFFCSKLTTCT